MSKLFGKMLSFDHKSNRLVFELSFVNEETFDIVDELIKEGKFHTIDVKRGRSEPAEYKFYRWYFSDIHEIILHQKKESGQPLTVSTDEKKVMSDVIKKELIDLAEIKIGEIDYQQPVPSLTSLDLKEIKTLIKNMEEIYSDMGVSFPVRLIEYEKGE